MKEIFYSIVKYRTDSIAGAKLHGELADLIDETIKEKQNSISADKDGYDNAIKQLILEFLEYIINDQETPNEMALALIKTKNLNEMVLWNIYKVPDTKSGYALRIKGAPWEKIVEFIYKDALNDISEKYNIHSISTYYKLTSQRNRGITFKSYFYQLYFLDSFESNGKYNELDQYVTYTTKEGNGVYMKLSNDEIFNGGKELCSRLKLDDTVYLKALKYKLDTAKENVSKAEKRVKTLKEKLKPLEEKYNQLDDGEKLMLELMQ